MTDQFVTVVCTKCNAEYEISVTYAGMPGECGNCGEVFVFPSKEDINAAFGYDVCGQVAAAQAAEAAAPQVENVAEQVSPPPVPEPAAEAPAPAFQGAAPAEDEVFTSTIKMSRSKIAGSMIPQLNDDEYGFSYVKKSVGTETASVTEKDIQDIKEILAAGEDKNKKKKKPAVDVPAKRKWWHYILFWVKPKS